MKKLLTLYKQTNVVNQIQQWTIEYSGNKYRTITGKHGGKLTTNVWTTCIGKNIGKSNETTPIQQAYLEATAKYQLKLDAGYTTDIKHTSKAMAKFIKPMLAKIYDDYDVSFGAYCQPKLDGIRCIITKEGMFSRLGKKFVSCPHILEAGQKILNTLPNYVKALDGELYNHQLRDDFNKICSLIKRQNNTEEDFKRTKDIIQFHWYDIIIDSMLYTGRKNIINRTITDSCIVKVPTKYVLDTTDLNYQYNLCLQQGYEGQIIRTDDDYQYKRTSYLLKRKPENDTEYKILAIDEGKGKRSGKAGHLWIEVPASSLGKSKANIKGSMEFLLQIWNDRQKLVGKLATVRYNGLTPDNVPRNPRVISIRDYE